MGWRWCGYRNETLFAQIAAYKHEKLRRGVPPMFRNQFGGVRQKLQFKGRAEMTVEPDGK